MIKASYDEYGNILIDGTIIGICKKSNVKMLLDTGFSGDLCLPISTACEVGLHPTGMGGVRLADGSIVVLPIFLGKIEMGEKIRDCSIFVVPGGKEVLIGGGLLKPYRVCFHAEKKEITIEEKFKEGHLSELKQSLRKIVPR